MSGIMDLVGAALGGDQVSQIARHIGASPEQTQQAIGAAMPTLLAALARNADDDNGAQSLHGALERDHDGSLLGKFGDLFGGSSEPAEQSKATAGSAILKHILGKRQSNVEQGVSKASGLGLEQVTKLLAVLGPIVMGVLGKLKGEKEMSPPDLSDLLRKERETVEAEPSGGGLGGMLLGKMLDQDGDGDFDMSDMMKIGMGKLFGK